MEELDFSKDYLSVDPEINNQKYAVMSIVTPEILKGCTKRLLKFRGAYFTAEQANDKCNEYSKKYQNHAEGVVEVGKWIPWSDIKDDKRDLLKELNKLMAIYLSERENSKVRHEKRKEAIKSKNEDIFDEPFKPENVEIIKETKSEVDKSKLKEIKYLENDQEIYVNKYFCISIFEPSQLEDEKYHDVKVRAFKIRGSYTTIEEAKERCEYLHSVDSHHNTFVGETGQFVHWCHNPEVENDEYSNKDLNRIMKAQKDNQEKARQFKEEQKKKLINESANNEIIDTDVTNIVSDMLDSTNEVSDQDNSSNVNLDTELDDVSKELEEAKLLYEKMLKDEN